MEKAVTQIELAELLGINRGTLRNVDGQLPADRKILVKREGSKYDLKIAIERWIDYKSNLGADDTPPPMNKKQLAALVGTSWRWLYEVDKQQGGKLFVPDQRNDKKYDACEFIRRWIEYQREKEGAEEEKGLDEVRAIHEWKKIRKTELEVSRMEGTLIDIGEVRRLWANIAATVMQNFLNLSKRVAPRLQRIDSVEEIADILDIEIREVLETVADTPIPDYIAAQEAEEPEETEDNEE